MKFGAHSIFIMRRRLSSINRKIQRKISVTNFKDLEYDDKDTDSLHRHHSSFFDTSKQIYRLDITRNIIPIIDNISSSENSDSKSSSRLINLHLNHESEEGKI